MFLLQITAFWISFFLLFKIALTHFKKTYWLVIVLFFAPFIQNFTGNIWKDIGLAISWLLALAIMLNVYYSKRKLKLYENLICFILLCYGCWIRINALPGVIPLTAIWIYMQTYPQEFKISNKRFVLKISAVVAVIIGLQLGITKLILKPAKAYPEYKLFLHDISGIYKKTGILYFPDFIIKYPGFDSVYLKQKYIYATFDNIWWNSDNKRIMPDVTEKNMAELQDAWIKALLKQPVAYFKNRTNGFLNFLRITPSGSELNLTYQYIHDNPYGLTFKKNAVTRMYYSYVENQRGMPYMQPWFWLLLTIISIYMAGKKLFRADRIFVLSLAYSSLLYIALEFLVYQADTEFRYFYWNCVAVCLIAIIFAFRYAEQKTKTESKV